MNNITNLLEKFRDMEITKDELNNIMKSLDEVVKVEVFSIHLINLLKNYDLKLVDDSYLLDWVNTIWFSDWYFYNEDQCDSIASVMNELEELDEEGNELTREKIKKYICALEKNLEL